MNRKKLLIVDVRLVAYQTYHKHLPFLTTLEIIAQETLKYVNPNRIIWAYDSPLGSVRRKELYPAYKAHRKEKIKTTAEKNKLKAFNENYDKLEHILPYLGNFIHLDGYEADDIANLFVDLTKDKYEVYMLSSDKDWIYNIKNEHIKQIHFNRGLIDIYNVEKEYNIKPDNVLKVQALTGIAKENIKGVYKLGETRVYRWLNEGLTLDEIIDQVEEFVKIGKYGMKLPDEFNSVREMYEFNYEILRPIELSDLTEEDKLLFLTQINRKEKISKEDLELQILKYYKKPYIFSNILSSFYKLK